MEETFNITVQLKAKNQVEAGQVKKAFETMVKNFKAEGIIKMEHMFKTDPFVRNIVKIKVGKNNGSTRSSI
ncbi:hypothetical protein J8281_03575 [Aquimarina sp. U1-2]|uniref:hypothetical protein n=1 Tax=Aquimarina sp. U1-2 TaxID=2823141 RepID=UPI001AECB582|nr:hypothetical protein [Aquimarina sp. U1-2]MBP2831258.1 hypothetical protein [Aquimarina sp. U1-2]